MITLYNRAGSTFPHKVLGKLIYGFSFTALCGIPFLHQVQVWRNDDKIRKVIFKLLPKAQDKKNSSNSLSFLGVAFMLSSFLAYRWRWKIFRLILKGFFLKYDSFVVHLFKNLVWQDIHFHWIHFSWVSGQIFALQATLTRFSTVFEM